MSTRRGAVGMTTTSAPGQGLMYALLTIHPMMNYTIRPMLAPLAEFVALENGL